TLRRSWRSRSCSSNSSPLLIPSWSCWQEFSSAPIHWSREADHRSSSQGNGKFRTRFARADASVRLGRSDKAAGSGFVPELERWQNAAYRPATPSRRKRLPSQERPVGSCWSHDKFLSQLCHPKLETSPLPVVPPQKLIRLCHRCVRI